ncbi:MAG TPA: hypothetical protein DEB09_03965 [Candidatus Magasanikbacteria bacterium]|nr:hypothetical protein [Candidatus Magasanikbacteria bacterium]
MKNILLCILVLLFLGFGCSNFDNGTNDKEVEKYLADKSIFLTETTIAQINGYSVGSGNYYLRKNDSGEEKMSIQLSIWKENQTEEILIRQIVFLDDIVKIGDEEYKLVLVEKNKIERSKALLIQTEIKK